MFCFVLVCYWSIISHNLCCYFTVIWSIIRMPQYHWNNPDKSSLEFSTKWQCDNNKARHNHVYILRSLQWRHNGRDSVSSHQPHECLLNRLFGYRSKKTSKLHVIGLCAGNSPEIGEFPGQMASNAESVFIWWRHRVNDNATITKHDKTMYICEIYRISKSDCHWFG